MSKKTRKIIDNTKFFLDRAPKKEADADREHRQRSLERLGLHWNNFQKRVVIQSRKLDELPELLNLFAWEIDQDVEIHPDVRQNFLKLVYLKMNDVYGRIELAKHVLQVMADCPNTINVSESDKGDAVKECGWGGLMVVRRAEFEAGTIEVECPQCKGKLTKVDLIKPEDVPQPPARNRFVRFRNGTIRPSDIHQFDTLEEFQAISYVSIFTGKPGFTKLVKNGQDVFAVVDGKPQRIGRVEFPDKLNVEELTPSGPSAQPGTAAEATTAGPANPPAAAHPADPAPERSTPPAP